MLHHCDRAQTVALMWTLDDREKATARLKSRRGPSHVHTPQGLISSGNISHFDKRTRACDHSLLKATGSGVQMVLARFPADSGRFVSFTSPHRSWRWCHRGPHYPFQMSLPLCRVEVPGSPGHIVRFAWAGP